MTTAADIQGVYARIVRVALNLSTASAVASAINSGSSTLANYIANLVGAVQTSTKPALIVTNYIVGITPDSATLDARANFCQIQYNAYVSAGVANPALGPYEALGLAFAVDPSFGSLIAGKSVAQVITDAYTHAFGTTPTAAQLANLSSQHTYFYGLYTGAGQDAATADRNAKGAVVGQVLGYAGTGSTTLSTKANTWLTNAGNGSPAYSTPL